jgi:hypothetical protein
LQYCERRAAGFRVVRVSGVESELDLPFAALQQLCGPLLNEALAIPEPQERALEIAFGLASGNPPDRFVVGLAVLSLLAELAGKQPLLCLVDDAQWLDAASSQVLAFVGRRLLAESILMLFAVREEGGAPRQLADLPELRLVGLAEADAQDLLTGVIAGPLDERVRDRILAATRWPWSSCRKE